MPRRCRRFTVSDARRLRSKVRLPPEVTDSDLAAGMNVEREHSDVTGCNGLKTAKIAASHLRERPDYYDRLKRYVEGRRWRSDTM